MKNFIVPGHVWWNEFVERLEGPEGCWVRTNDDGAFTCDCDGNLERSARILREMGCREAELSVTLEYFKRHGGYCDCEVLLNVGVEPTRI